MPVEPEAGSGHVNIIDPIRGLAALSVMYFHDREINWVGMRAYWQAHAFDHSIGSVAAYLTFPVVWGAIGVPIFFVISGYVIHRRAAQTSANGNRRFSTAAFLLRRFIRIYPTLLAALALTYLCDTIARTYAVHYKLGNLDATTLLWNVLALQGVLARPFGSDGPLWSLSVEIQFYLLYPIALVVWRRIGASWMLAASAAVTVIGYWLVGRKGVTAFPQYYLAWWLGAYIADHEASGRRLFRFARLSAILLFSAGCLMALSNLPYLAFMTWACGFAASLAVLIDRWPNRIAVPPMLRRLGDCSYSLYAIHVPLLVLISSVLFAGKHQDSIFWSFAIAAPVLALCYVFYLLVERPSLMILQRLRH